VDRLRDLDGMGHRFDGLNGLRRPEPLAADDKDGFFSFIALGLFISLYDDELTIPRKKSVRIRLIRLIRVPIQKKSL